MHLSQPLHTELQEVIIELGIDIQLRSEDFKKQFPKAIRDALECQCPSVFAGRKRTASYIQ